MTQHDEKSTAVQVMPKAGPPAPMFDGDADQFAVMVRNEVDIQIATGKAYPRDALQSMKDSIASIIGCEGLAEECIYSLPKAGMNIQGPSIRMAEVVAYHWQNLRIHCRFIGEFEKHIEVEGCGMDLQNNIGATCPVRRGIVDKYGKRYKPDVIVTTVAAAMKIAYRNVVFTLCPPHITHTIYRAVKQHAVGDLADLPKRWQKATVKWLTLGITEKMLLKHLEIDSSGKLTIADFEYLIGLFTAINEGTVEKDKVFAETKSQRTKVAADRNVDELSQDMEADGETPKDAPKDKPKSSAQKTTPKKKASAKKKTAAQMAKEGISSAAETAAAKNRSKTDSDPNAQPPDEESKELGPDDYLLDERVEPMFDSKEVLAQGRDAMIRQALEDGLTVDELLEQINELPEPPEKDPITIDDGPTGDDGEGGEQTELEDDGALY